jgi:hypothetical protein
MRESLRVLAMFIALCLIALAALLAVAQKVVPGSVLILKTNSLSPNAAALELVYEQQRDHAIAASISPVPQAVVPPAPVYSNGLSLWGSPSAFRYGPKDPRNQLANIPLVLLTSSNLSNWTVAATFTNTSGTNAQIITVTSKLPTRFFRLTNQ